MIRAEKKTRAFTKAGKGYLKLEAILMGCGYIFFFFCKAQAMIAERKIRLCKLLSSESETIEIKTLQHHCVNLWRIAEAF